MPEKPREVTDLELQLLETKQKLAEREKQLERSEKRGLSKPLGGTIEIELGGKTYTMAPLELRDIEQLEAWIRRDRVAAVMTACDGLPPAEKAHAIAKTAAEPVTLQDVEALATSVRGGHQMALLCLRHNHPNITIEEVRIITDDLEGLVSLINQMSDLWEEPAEDEEPEDRPTEAEPSPGTGS